MKSEDNNKKIKSNKLKLKKGDKIKVILDAIVVVAEKEFTDENYYEAYLPDVGHTICLWDKDIKKKVYKENKE